jgi:hypothetical protein
MNKQLRITTLLLFLAPGTSLAADLPADCSTAKPPAQPVQASISGVAYAPNFVKLVKAGTMKSDDEAFDTWRLALRSLDSVMAPLEIDVTVIVPKGQLVDGKVFRRLPDKSISKQPMASKSSGMPEVQGWSFANRKAGLRGSHVKYFASLRLEFGQREGKTIGGTINLCVPKGQKSTFDKTPTTADSYAIGTFEAMLK